MSKKRLVEFTGYNHRYYVFRTAKAALSQFFEQMGCQTKELTIARAMKQYFESPDSLWNRRYALNQLIGKEK